MKLSGDLEVLFSFALEFRWFIAAFEGIKRFWRLDLRFWKCKVIWRGCEVVIIVRISLLNLVDIYINFLFTLHKFPWIDCRTVQIQILLNNLLNLRWFTPLIFQLSNFLLCSASYANYLFWLPLKLFFLDLVFPVWYAISIYKAFHFLT